MEAERILDQGDGEKFAGVGIERTLGPDDFCFPLVLRGLGWICEGVRQGDIDRSVAFLSRKLDERNLGRAQRNADFCGGGGENRAKLGRGTYGLTEAYQALFDATMKRGSDLCALEVSTALLEIGFGGTDVRFGFAELWNPHDEGRGFFIITDVLPVEFCLFGTGLLLDEGCLRAGKTRFRGENFRFEIRRVELQQDLTLLEKSPVFEGRVNLHDGSGNQRSNRGLLLGADRSLRFDDDPIICPVQDDFLGLQFLAFLSLWFWRLDRDGEPFPCKQPQPEDQDGDGSAEEEFHHGVGVSYRIADFPHTIFILMILRLIYAYFS